MWPFKSKQPPPAPAPPATDKPKAALNISWDTLARSHFKPGRDQTVDMLLQPPEPPPYVRKYGTPLALDENLSWASGFLTGSPGVAGGFRAGQNFGSVAWPGFGFLSQLAVVPEIYLVSACYAEHCTRKSFELVSLNEKDLSEPIKKLNEELERLDVRKVLHDVVLYDGLFGRAHTYIDLNVRDPDEMLTNIGDGSDKALISKAKIKEGSLEAIRVCDPFFVFPQAYEASRPISPWFYVPETWLASADLIHSSRLLPWISSPVPDILKAAWSFAGLSRSQMCLDVISEYRQNRTDVSALLHAFNTKVLATDLSASLNVGGDEVYKRAEFLSNLADNLGVLLLNKDTEEYQNIAAPLGGLSDLMKQSAERISMVSKIPEALLWGTSAEGLSATDEPAIEIFAQHVHALQERFLTPNLMRIVRFAQLNIFGRVNPNIGVRWVELFEMGEKERGEHNAKLAEVDRTYIDAGVLSQMEVRERVAADESSGYNNIDVSKLPEPPMPDEADEGLEDDNKFMEAAE